MSWDFETDPEFQTKLDWVDTFLRDEVEPLDFVLSDPYDKSDERALAIIRPLQQQVKDQGLWACHLGPDLGGPGLVTDWVTGATGYPGIAAQLLIQAKAVAVVVIWTSVVSFVSFNIVKLVIGLRVNEDDEREGLDITTHGERAWEG